MENDKINRQYQSKLEDEKTTNATVQQSANYDFKTKFIEYKNYAKVRKIETSGINREYLLRFEISVYKMNVSNLKLLYFRALLTPWIA